MIEWNKKSVLKKMSTFLCVLFGLIFSIQSTVWAEVATASDEQVVQDAVVLGKVVPNANLPNILNPKAANLQQTAPNSKNNQASMYPKLPMIWQKGRPHAIFPH